MNSWTVSLSARLLNSITDFINFWCYFVDSFCVSVQLILIGLFFLALLLFSYYSKLFDSKTWNLNAIIFVKNNKRGKKKMIIFSSSNSIELIRAMTLFCSTFCSPDKSIAHSHLKLFTILTSFFLVGHPDVIMRSSLTRINLKSIRIKRTTIELYCRSTDGRWRCEHPTRTNFEFSFFFVLGCFVFVGTHS